MNRKQKLLVSHYRMKDQATNILIENMQVPFINRWINRKDYPKFDNQDGTYSTHKLKALEHNDEWYVFPTLDYDNNEWIDLTNKEQEALELALRKGNYLTFFCEETAKWFADNAIVDSFSSIDE